MKKLLYFSVVLTACCLMFGGFHLSKISAQSAVEKFDIDVATQEERAVQDRALATTIRQLTDRSTDGLVKRKIKGVGFVIDLEDRFQNVMLARRDIDGEISASCITSTDEANQFFGRNLDSGEIISNPFFQRDEAKKLAAQHGMSEQEFEFYKKLIEEAAMHRMTSPNLATINIVNGDGAGEGFNSAAAPAVAGEGGNTGTTLGGQRLELFNFAAGIWSAYLDSTVQINISSRFNPLTPCSTSGGVLGSAGAVNIHAFGSGAPLNNTWYHAALANKIAGSDLNANPEISATFNSDVDTGCLGAGTRFYYGLNSSTPSGTINLLIVLLHEMGHGLGFSSFVSSGSVVGATNTSPITITTFSSHGLANGEQVTIQAVAGNTAANGVWTVTNVDAVNKTFQLVGSTGNGAYTGGGSVITGKLTGGLPDVYTTFMYDRTTGKNWNGMTDAERQASTLNNGNVLWDGANVKIASGFLTAGREASTGRVQLYTPSTFAGGSSISHFDTAATTNLLMEPFINAGIPTNLDLTRQQMRDIGWYRDSDGNISSDTITAVQPTTAVYKNASATVTWSNNGGFNKNVTIELSTDNGTSYSTLASNIANTGSYTFTAPNTTTTQGRLRVTEYDFAAPRGESSNFSIIAPTSADVIVSGRVKDKYGRGISGAVITVTSSNGNVTYAKSNLFGYFSVLQLKAGETYVFQVAHKRYTFAPQIMNFTEDFMRIEFSAQ